LTRAAVTLPPLGEDATVGAESPLRHSSVSRIEFDQNSIPLQAIGDQSGGAGATEMIKRWAEGAPVHQFARQ